MHFVFTKFVLTCDISLTFNSLRWRPNENEEKYFPIIILDIENYSGDFIYVVLVAKLDSVTSVPNRNVQRKNVWCKSWYIQTHVQLIRSYCAVLRTNYCFFFFFQENWYRCQRSDRWCSTSVLSHNVYLQWHRSDFKGKSTKQRPQISYLNLLFSSPTLMLNNFIIDAIPAFVTAFDIRQSIVSIWITYKVLSALQWWCFGLRQSRMHGFIWSKFTAASLFECVIAIESANLRAHSPSKRIWPRMNCCKPFCFIGTNTRENCGKNCAVGRWYWAAMLTRPFNSCLARW